ncbi:MAG: WbqC family protein [Bacteroidota bacterium]
MESCTPQSADASPTLLIDLHYLPSLAYFACLLPYPTIRLEAHESYQKQTYRNRCYILTSQKVDRLTIPVRHQAAQGLYSQTAIAYEQPWQEMHWRALCTAYSKAPYFTYFAEYFYAVLSQKPTYLFELNRALLQTCLQLLQLAKTIELSSNYDKVLPSHVVDARSTMHPQSRSAPSPYYHPVPYQQVFGENFSPNLSILDLLFCQGPHATAILQQSAKL